MDESINIADPTYCAFLSRKGRISISHKTKKMSNLCEDHFSTLNTMQFYNLQIVILRKTQYYVLWYLKMLNILFQVSSNFSQTPFDIYF